MTVPVSVALCTYNGGPYIRAQLESILAQQVPDLEIVVSDDGSSDGTLDVVRDVARRAHESSPDRTLRIRVLENRTPLGIAANFEQAIFACSHGIIALSDQDDIWRPGRLRALVDRIEADDALALLHSNAQMVDENGDLLGYRLSQAINLTESEVALIHGGNGFGVLLRRNVVTGATSVIRAELASRAFPIPEGWLHDEWLAIVAAVTAQFDFLDIDSIDYRQHGNNQIGQLRPNLSIKLGRLTEPRTVRNRRLLARATGLAERVRELADAVSPLYVDLVEGKLAHEEMRSALSVRRLLRLLPVVREARKGGYGQFGRGTADILRDLVQPAH
jgi:glycosyltransferase involved in cell wall biosynthesis